VGLIKAFMIALVLGLPGLRAVAARGADLLDGCNHSALSHAVRRRSSLAMVRALLKLLEPRHTPGDGELVVIDSMPVTLPATYRHGCRRVTPTTVGGGVLWTFALNAARGASPVRIVKVIEGAWHDSCLMEGVELLAQGPIYLMDRGFYAIDLVARWVARRVWFIARAKSTHLRYEVERLMGPSRKVGTLHLTLDAVVRLGGPNRPARRKACPRVRMVRATLPGGEELIVVSNLMERSAEYLLETYRQRWQIERFHYYLKETLGLAHLYSFQQKGLAFLVHVAVLLCVLLLLAGGAEGGLTVDRLRGILNGLRRACGVFGLWRRNTMRKGQTRHLKKKQNL
jgi:hypothetical protein